MSPHDDFFQSPRNRLLLTLLVAWSCCLALLAARDDTIKPRPAVVDRFYARTETAVRSLTMRRRLEARNERYRKQGWIDAAVSVDPVRGFRYEVVAEGGSGYVRDNVLRKALAREATRRYQRIAGIRLPLSLEPTAQILLAGASTFSMTYHYEEVNGERLDGNER